MSAQTPNIAGLLVLPHLRIQNANAISSPVTHGFPSMTAFLGLMWALERKLNGRGLPLVFDSVGVICHDFEELSTEGGYTKAFRLTRNPVDKDGSTAAIVEEGRIHLELTLVFGVSGGFTKLDAEQRQALASVVAEAVASMRIAGGSIIPAKVPRWQTRPALEVLADDEDDAAARFRQLRRKWLPGFALVCRDDLLWRRTEAMQAASSTAPALDAWLDLSRFNWKPKPMGEDAAADPNAKVEWQHDRTEGWLVPIPVGYGALARHGPGEVANARDPSVPFAFVESLYSIGQWIGPHRLNSWRDLLWYSHTEPENGLYRVRNDYAPPAAAVA